MDEFFDSSARSSDDLAGVFEFDGESGYFYLYKLDNDDGGKILSAININSPNIDCAEKEIKIEWSDDESVVILKIKNVPYAAFDCLNNVEYAGDYQHKRGVTLPGR